MKCCAPGLVLKQRQKAINGGNGVFIISESRTRAIVAFDPDQWRKWYKDDPKLANIDRRPLGKRLVPDSQKFLDTGGDVHFLLKSDVQGELEKVLDFLQEKMKDYCRNFDVTKSQPPSKVWQCVNVNVRYY